MPKKKVYNKEQAAAAHKNVDLPPAGYKRVEELAKRQDDLDKAAQEFTDNGGLAPINPKAFEEDRDIQRQIHKDYFHLHMKEGWVCRFVNFVSHRGASAWKARAEGWIPVSKDMVEDRDKWKFEADNTVRVGDVMAFAIPQEEFDKIEKERADRLRMQEYGLESDIEDMVNKHPDTFKFHAGIQDGRQFRSQMQSRGASQTALQHLGNQMKKGPIKGLPIK